MTFFRVIVLALAVVAAATKESTDSLAQKLIPSSVIAEKQIPGVNLESGDKGGKYCNRPDKKPKYKVNCPVPAPVPPPTNPVPPPTVPVPPPTNPADCKPTVKPVCPSCNNRSKDKKTRGLSESHGKGGDDHGKGHDDGHGKGHDDGHGKGHDDGHGKGHDDGHGKGHDDGHGKGYGHDDGHGKGHGKGDGDDRK